MLRPGVWILSALALLLTLLASLDLAPAWKLARGVARPPPRVPSVQAPAPPPPPWEGGADDREIPRAQPSARASADLVVVVSIDGLRPDVITPSMRALHRLSERAASPQVARTIGHSETLPSHASMVSGVEPSEHGLNFNAYRPEHGNIDRPTMFSVARAAGMPTLMFVGKSKLKHILYEPEDAELKVGSMRCRRLLRVALPRLKAAKRGLLFMHFADPDFAGHRYGWMSDRYVDAAHDAAECVEQVVEVIQQSGRVNRTLLIVTADHGGHDRGHGTQLEVDQRIPWYAWGARARRGRVQRDVHTTDTAATALAALGLKVPTTMRGRPVTEAIGAALGPVGMPIVGAPIEASAP